jgi:hypothetical protein
MKLSSTGLAHIYILLLLSGENGTKKCYDFAFKHMYVQCALIS